MFQDAANADGSPPDTPSRDNPDYWAKVSAPPGRNLESGEFDRLRRWLNYLAGLAANGRSEAQDAYIAVLQGWLHLHNISWPDGVFKASPFGRGRGAPIDPGVQGLHNDVFLLGRGKSAKEIAQTLVPGPYAKNPAKVVKEISEARRTRRSRGLDDREDLLDSVCRMLGVPTDEDLSDRMREQYEEILKDVEREQ